MKEKLKKINLGVISNILKSSLVGVIVSILLVLLFAFVLKFVDLSSGAISLIDQIIKVLSILVAVISLNKVSDSNLLVKSLLVGMAYAIITFIVFSILNGGISFGIGIVSDMAFSALVGGVSSIIINMVRKK